MAYKTRVMNYLDQRDIIYVARSYAEAGVVSGMEAAAAMNENPSKVLKTLVTVGKSGENYVFLVPVDRSLSLEKAAEAAGEKSIGMIKTKELLPLTGYVHGGCSPVNMTTKLKTIIDKSAESFDTVLVNAGKIGYMFEISLPELSKVLDFSLFDVSE